MSHVNIYQIEIKLSLYMYVRICICMCVCMCVYMYTYRQKQNNAVSAPPINMRVYVCICKARFPRVNCSAERRPIEISRSCFIPFVLNSSSSSSKAYWKPASEFQERA